MVMDRGQLALPSTTRLPPNIATRALVGPQAAKPTDSESDKPSDDSAVDEAIGDATAPLAMAAATPSSSSTSRTVGTSSGGQGTKKKKVPPVAELLSSLAVSGSSGNIGFAALDRITSVAEQLAKHEERRLQLEERKLALAEAQQASGAAASAVAPMAVLQELLYQLQAGGGPGGPWQPRRRDDDRGRHGDRGRNDGRDRRGTSARHAAQAVLLDSEGSDTNSSDGDD